MEMYDGALPTEDRMKFVIVFAASSLFMAGPAIAQAAAPPSTDGQAEEALQSAEPTVGEVSDAEVERFALAALLVQQIAEDQAVEADQKQATMAAAVEQIGLDPQRFNEIAEATQSDQELNERVQVAATRHVEAAQQNQ
jgi:hypothetical protein